MEPETSNPYRSPREESESQRPPAEGASDGVLERLLTQLAGIAAFSFALLCLAFFAVAAVDSLRPHSLIHDNPRAHPPTPYPLRVATCVVYSLMALPFLGIMGYLLRGWRAQVAERQAR